MSFPRYPKCKDSGVEWLGEVPEGWGMSRIRYVTQCLDGKRVPLNSIERADRSGDIPYWGANSIMDYIDSALFDEDLVLLGEDGAPFFDPYRPVAFLSSGPVWPNNHIHVLRPRCQTLARYITYCLNATSYIYYVDGSTRDKLTQSGMNSIPLPWPPEREALLITDFLDRETAKIDALVAEQENLIALLKEKRQAVISHAVTKGLDPTVPMKDSGIEWLGEVPAHWNIAPLMHLTDPARPIMYGIVLPGPNVDVGIPIVKGGDVKDHRLKLELLNRTTPEIEAPFARARLKPLDIVYSIRGTIGDAEVVPIELQGANITQDVARISPARNIETKWLLHVMKSKPVFVQLEQRSLGAAVRGINIFELKRARIPVPPLSERAEIADFLDTETTKLDDLTTEAQHTIDLLKERRSALISAAVTGKIDVRVYHVHSQPIT